MDIMEKERFSLGQMNYANTPICAKDNKAQKVWTCGM